MGTERIRIGDMLVAAGFVTEEQVQQALARQKHSGRRLGEELVEGGFVNEVQLTQILSNQLSVPWVSLYHIEFSRELLNLVPRDVAQKYCLIPIYVRKVRRAGDTLFVAMDDPTNEEALERVRETAQLPVKAMVAPPTEVRDAIRVSDMQTVQKLAECKDPNDAVKLQTECWSECVRDYMQEAQRLCELASIAGSSYLSSLDGSGYSEGKALTVKASSKTANEAPEKAQAAK